ncbi:uncharacterized protein [Eurosta solidaginis]|uniref:uncharacterized protein isoform X2 n=1 Tax=Eurosta solidaginis TaxID=178769 RepID=UPI0035307DF4
MCFKAIFSVTISSLVFYLVEAQNRLSSTTSHHQTHPLPVQPLIASYIEPVKRVEISHVEVDIILRVTPSPPAQAYDATQPLTTSHFTRIVNDDTALHHEQQNLNSRKEFNDRNRNYESDSNNNKQELVREPVRTSGYGQEWETQIIDKHNQVREPIRTSEFNQERRYEIENNRNQRFEREPERLLNQDNSSTEAQDQRRNDFDRGKEYGHVNNHNPGNNHEPQKIVYQTTSTGNYVREPIRTSDFNQERKYEIENNGNQRFEREPERLLNQDNSFTQAQDQRRNDFDRGRDYGDVNNHNQGNNRDPERIIYQSANINYEAELYEDSKEIFNTDIHIKESGKRTQNIENAYENSNNQRKLVKEPAHARELNRELEYEEESKAYLGSNRGNEIKRSEINQERKYEDGNYNQGFDRERLLIHEHNYTLAKDPRTNDFDRGIENIEISNDNKGANYKPDSALDRRAENNQILNQHLTRDRDIETNRDNLQGGNNRRQKLVTKPIHTNDFIQNRDYERTTSQGNNHESERNIDQSNSHISKPDRHNDREDILTMESRERPQSTEPSNMDKNTKHKSVNAAISKIGLNKEREFEDTKNHKQNINRNPVGKLNQDRGFNSTPSRRVDKNETFEQNPKTTSQKTDGEGTKAKENSQKAKANQKNQKRKTRRICEKKYSEYIERIYSNDDDTTADANDSEFDGRVLASPGEYPHMTALGFKRKDGSIDYKCGGSLISENFVITAAHCTNFTGEVPTIARIGDINLMKDEKYVEPQMYRIRKIYIQPEYDGITHYNDIALLQLNTSVDFSEFVRPIKLWSRSDLPFSMAFAMGYGATSFARAPTQQLTDFNMTIIANDECNERLPQLGEIPHGIVESLICAEDLVMHRDTCQGDSGGPLQYNIRGRRRKNRIHYQLIGITSFGLLCRSPNPGVYQRIYSFLDWIESNVWTD